MSLGVARSYKLSVAFLSCEAREGIFLLRPSPPCPSRVLFLRCGGMSVSAVSFWLVCFGVYVPAGLYLAAAKYKGS